VRCEGCGAEVLLGSANCGSCGRSLLGDAFSNPATTATDTPATPAPIEAVTSFDAPPPPPPGWTLADGAGRQALLPPPPSGPSYSSALRPPKDQKGCGCGVIALVGVVVVVAAIVGVVVALVDHVRGERLQGPDLALGEVVRFGIGANDTGVHDLALGEGAVTITVRSRDDDFDPKLRVTEADGTFLGENDDAIGLDSQLSLTLAEGADLVVEVTEFSGDAGDYEVEVSSGAAGPAIDPSDFDTGERVVVGELPVDESVEQHLGHEDVAVHHLSGFEGRVSISVTGIEGFDPVLRVVGADGVVIGENDDTDGRDSFLTFVLGRDDELDVEVREFSGSPGFYSIRLQRGDGTQPAVVLGDPLRLGQPTAGEVVEDQVARHDFAGDGAVVDVAVVGLQGFDPVVRVIAPNGDVLAENDDSDGLDAHVEVQLPAATVTIEVQGYSGRPGRYEVTVS
jgi:hypothetical protein